METTSQAANRKDRSASAPSAAATPTPPQQSDPSQAQPPDRVPRFPSAREKRWPPPTACTTFRPQITAEGWLQIASASCEVQTAPPAQTPPTEQLPKATTSQSDLRRQPQS